MAEEFNSDPNVNYDDPLATQTKAEDQQSPASEKAASDKDSSHGNEEPPVQVEEHHHAEQADQPNPPEPKVDLPEAEAQGQHHEHQPQQVHEQPSEAQVQAEETVQPQPVEPITQHQQANPVGIYEIPSEIYVSNYSNFQDIDAAATKEAKHPLEESVEVYQLAQQSDGVVVGTTISDPHDPDTAAKEAHPNESDNPHHQAQQKDQHTDPVKDHPQHDKLDQPEQQAVAEPLQPGQVAEEFNESMPVEIVPSAFGDTVPVDIILPSTMQKNEEAAQQDQAQAVANNQETDDISAQKQEGRQDQPTIDWSPTREDVPEAPPATPFQKLVARESHDGGVKESISSSGKFNLLDPPPPPSEPVINANSQEELLHTIKIHEENMRRSTEKRKQELDEMKGNSFLQPQLASEDQIHLEKHHRIERQESEVPVPQTAETFEEPEPKREIKRADYIDVNGEPRPKPIKEQRPHGKPQSCKCSVM